MVAVVICVAVPIMILGMMVYVQLHYGDELFKFDWRSHDLNRADDYWLIKLPLQGYNQQSDQ